MVDIPPPRCPICGVTMVTSIKQRGSEQAFQCQCGHLEMYRDGQWTYQCELCGQAETCRFRLMILDTFAKMEPP